MDDPLPQPAHSLGEQQIIGNLGIHPQERLHRRTFDRHKIAITATRFCGMAKAATNMLDLIDPSLSRRRALGWLAAGGGAALWPSSLLSQSAATVVEPEAFGHFGDGQGDAAPAINAAIAALARGDGGTLRFRSGKTYLLDATVDATAQTAEAYRSSIAIPPAAKDITFDLNGAVLRQVSDAMTFGCSYRLFNDRKVADTAIPLAAPASRGDASVHLRSTAAVRPGMICMLVARNTLADKDYAPIAEMLVISRVEGNSVLFDRTLRKDYRPNGNWPFGLIDASAISAINIAIVGPGRVINDRRRASNLIQLLGARVQNVTFEGRGGLGLRGRDILVTDCSAAIQANWSPPVFRPFCLAFDTGSSDVRVHNFHATGGSNMTYLHLHEAQANVAVSGLSIRNGTLSDPHGEQQSAISILGGSWSVVIASTRVTNNPQGSAIEARRSGSAGTAQSELTLSNIAIDGQFRTTPVLVAAQDGSVRIDRLDLRGAHTIGGKPLMQIGGQPEMSEIQGWPRG
jgi:hypothetical protein